MRSPTALTVVLLFLLSITTTLARPLDYDREDAITSRSIRKADLRRRDEALGHSGVDYDLRSWSGDYPDAALEARAKGEAYTPRPPRQKVSAAAQQQRKAAVKARVAAAQAQKKKPARPPMQKGAAKSAKAKATQARADIMRKSVRGAHKIMFKDARAKYDKTTSLPTRKTTFTANGVTVTGKDVRTAVFNSHHFAGNRRPKPGPKQFNNRLQGPPDNRHKTLPKMRGKGDEFPVTNQRGGYQGGDVGAMRIITQRKEAGGTSFKGVIAHDSSVQPGQPGYSDHHQVKGVKPPKRMRG